MGGGKDPLSQTSFCLPSLTRGHQGGTWSVPKGSNSLGPEPRFPASYWNTGTTEMLNNTYLVPNLAFFSMKGAEIVIKPGYIVTFCSMRKLFLAVPNAAVLLSRAQTA